MDYRSLADQGIDRAPEQHLGGRRVRQLAPDQREALLERRAAEDELHLTLGLTGSQKRSGLERSGKPRSFWLPV